MVDHELSSNILHKQLANDYGGSWAVKYHPSKTTDK
uniref:Uncharacterized protein n=1 Tax=Rhizophora mucronata TaxID=61149 RepID=A0A2P2MZF9_RHIMU